MHSLTIAEAFAAETNPKIISVMLADFALEAIKKFGPEYMRLNELVQIANGNRNN